MRVFYDPRQTVAGVASFSPSAGKPARVVDAWRAAGIPLEIEVPRPCTPEEIALAHDRAYVDGVLSGTLQNGFGNRDTGVAASLPWTTGSFASAALHASTTGEPTASPTSGFHHATHAFGGGFCTFNGLIVAAQLVRRRFSDRDVGILDCDVHYGNGTDYIVDRLNLGFVRHWTFGGNDITPETADAWLGDLPRIVATFAGCSVLLYQAGADPHVDDPLGGVLTSAQMRERDRIVFENCRRLGLPVAWNLAGGYQTPIQRVLALHTATAQACVAAFDR